MIDIQVDDVEGKFRQMGVRFYPLTMERQGKNPLRESRSVNQIYRIMRVTRPDVSLSYSVKSTIYGS